MAIFGYSVTLASAFRNIDQVLFTERGEQTRRIVEMVHSLVGHYYDLTERGLLDVDSAKQQALERLSAMRYDGDQYIWVNDTDGVMIMHPTMPELVGTNITDLRDAKDNRVFVGMIDLIKKQSAGHYGYFWPPNSTGKEKKSYVKAFLPWGWVIGSGIYVDDIKAQVWREIGRLAIVAGFILLITGGLAFWIGRSVALPIGSLTQEMLDLASGNTAITIAGVNRRDEIGELARAVDVFKRNAIDRDTLAADAELERHRLQAAVSNMPVGLCMFDHESRLIICNERYAAMYGLDPDLTRPGTLLDDILRHGVGTVRKERTDIPGFLEQSEAPLPASRLSSSVIEYADGRAFSVACQPIRGGGFVATYEDVTERRRTEARISHMASHDALTDLPNRWLLRNQLEKVLMRLRRAETEAIAVLCLDLDHFKSVNDTLGHPVGDALLQAVADRLRRCVRETDTISRLGGDEFAILQVGADQPVASTLLAQRLISALSAPYDIDGHQIIIGASVGIAIAPDDGTDADQLLKCGDMALYRAKSDGRGTYRLFEQAMDARMQARRALELDLRRALAAREFSLAYQPIVSLTNNRVSTVEALLRWRHPERGLIAPDSFIPLAEEIGLIVPLGEWILRQACLDAVTWPEAIKLAVNLSPTQFKSANLVPSVSDALKCSGLPADRLELEITETALFDDSDAAFIKLQKLHDIGVSIAMDDFGTGYSSLSFLHRFPFDKIKIDRSFIAEVLNEDGSFAILRAVSGLGRTLGIRTTAEGVETEAQLECVRTEGCTEAQGYLFSRPVPASEIHALLSAATPSAQLPSEAA